MQVILLEDVAGVGRKHDIVTVSNGYARNFLIPRKKAVYATEKEIQHTQELKKTLEHKKSEKQSLLEAALARISGKTFSIQEKTNEVGGLFKSIGSEEIARMLSTKEGILVPPEALQIKSPIKKSGEYTIELRAGTGKGILTLLVSGEKEETKPKKKKRGDSKN
ncbi:MAG TPA: 50S ribosomal protein L9 [Candidatus Paceibacterota bacterium]